jgi:hypothetical protein
VNEDLADCLSLNPRRLGEESVGHCWAMEGWRDLVRSCSFHSTVIEADPRIAGHRIVAFGASVFVSRAFADEEIADPRKESAGINYSHRSPKGNRHMRRLLNQAANAAARTKGSLFEIVYRRSIPRLGHNQAIGVIAHRLCRLIWLILHQGAQYEERGPAVTKRSKQLRTWKMIRQLRTLGYRIEPPSPRPGQSPVQ